MSLSSVMVAAPPDFLSIAADLPSGLIYSDCKLSIEVCSAYILGAIPQAVA